MNPEVVATGIGFPEGLAWSSRTEELFCSACQDGAIWRISSSEQRKELLTRIGGGANNLVLASDGGCVVTQNGGIDMYEAEKSYFPFMEYMPPPSAASPGLVRVLPDGSSRYLRDTGLNAPNDITVAADGSLVFTDPGRYGAPASAQRRVMRYGPDGELSVVASGFQYCNGIVTIADSMYVIDLDGVHRVEPDGSSSRFATDVGEPYMDGITADRDGRLYVTVFGGVNIVEDGAVVDHLEIPPGDGHTSNCVFGGPEGRWLFATDGTRGTVVVFTDMPVPGQETVEWTPPAT